MKRTLALLLTIALLLIAAHRLPAPISEVETPAPAPEQSAKPKPKRTTKPKATSENSESQAKTVSPTPKTQATPNRNLFDGTWRGTINNVPFAGNVDFTLVITAAGTVVIEKSANFGTKNWQANCDGRTMRWAGTSWTLTPNPDSQTALVTLSGAGFLGIGASSSSTIFRKTSP